MSEEEQDSVTEPVAEAPESDTPTEPEVSEQKESLSSKNFRVLEEERDYWRRMAEEQYRASQVKQAPPEDDFDLSKVDPNDVPSYAELNKILSKQDRERQALQAKLADLEAKTTYKDYDTVINSYLPEVLKDDPALLQALQENPNMTRLAYRLAQSNPKYHEDRLAKINKPSVDRMVSNATKTQPATTRKGIAAHGDESQLENMSDDDIMKVFNMAKARY